MKRIVKRVILIFLIIIAVLIIGLLINNLVVGKYYKGLDTHSDSLDSSEIEGVENVYNTLSEQTEEIIPGLNSDIDLIISNSDYEFLFSSEEQAGGWEFIKHNSVVNKDLYRRAAINPQAFTTYVDNRWVGSMSTRNYLNRDVIMELPFFMPPQIYVSDEVYYEAVVIHEMTHALQGNMNNDRMNKDQHLHNICVGYRDNSEFNDYINDEAGYLQLAVDADSVEDTIKYARLYLQTRDDRRNQFNMSQTDVNNEKEVEWLEGTGRYVEYCFSRDSDCLIAQGLGNIEEKMKQAGDDRYYVSGMAQAMILDKLDEDWKNRLFEDDFYYEDALKAIINGED